jgi:hypothetical protein
MTRSAWIRPFFLFLFLSVMPAGLLADQPLPNPHVRSTEPELVAALEQGTRASATLRRLVDVLEHSDVIVYLAFDRNPSPELSGHISLTTTAGERRYLRISIDPRTVGCQRLALLGHELQHAVEIAESRLVTDDATLTALYRRIGFKSGGNSRGECFDSVGAILAGQIVQKEVLAAGVSGTQ